MNLKLGGVGIAIIGISIFIIFLGMGFEKNSADDVFHVTLADPAMYKNGVFTDLFEIEKGIYQFEFVPNGDSPKTLTISLSGPEHNYVEKFVLNSESHETGISQYFTWNYTGDGESKIEISSPQEVQIIINPHENYDGPVSIFLKKLP
ncbi:MAG TPA: hypothetical protein VFG25_02410 [Nitrosopumilaceae archaeon]|nr:hypothetical protein [Nitrosopumilaceae archaeon]